MNISLMVILVLIEFKFARDATDDLELGAKQSQSDPLRY